MIASVVTVTEDRDGAWPYVARFTFEDPADAQRCAADALRNGFSIRIDRVLLNRERVFSKGRA